jgi:predicted nucleic acid-binding protein
MATSVIVDAGFLIALLSGSDANHAWAAAQAARLPPPWKTCEAAVSDAFRLLGPAGISSLGALLHRRAVLCSFHPGEESEHLTRLMLKYAHVPMSFADACLVRMSETMSDPVLLTTSVAFRAYRRHGRRAVPCVLPGPIARQQAADAEAERKSNLDDMLKDVTRIFRDDD